MKDTKHSTRAPYNRRDQLGPIPYNKQQVPPTYKRNFMQDFEKRAITID